MQSDSGESRTALPMIHDVGIIPLQIEESQGSMRGLGMVIENIDLNFSKAVKESNRFRVAENELVKILWSNSEGRQELKIDYEIDSFLGLTVIPFSDTVLILCRMLSTEMSIYLQESETFGRFELENFSAEERYERIRNLLFRMLNRLPVDVYVTSIQGPYVTLSGGTLRGLRIGSELKIYRPSVSERHPANHTWLSFAKQQLGNIRIIEVTDHTSVARVEDMVFENAIEVGDGGNISAVPSRSQFAQAFVDEESASGNEPILVAPIYSPGHEPSRGINDESTELAADAFSEALAEDRSGSPEHVASDDYRGFVGEYADAITFKTGQSGWWFLGKDVGAGSKVVWYLPVNVFGVTFNRSIYPYLKYDVGVGLGFGKTTGLGSYQYTQGEGRIYFEQKFPVPDTIITHWQVGGQGSFSGLGVSGGSYGGQDVLRGGVYGGLYGELDFGHAAEAFDWFGEFSITPLTLGRIGYAGKYRTARSSFGWDLSGGLIKQGKIRSLEWGGAFTYGSQNILDSDGSETGGSRFAVMALARWRYRSHKMRADIQVPKN